MFFFSHLTNRELKLWIGLNMKNLIELWIINESGTLLFHYSLEKKVDPVLFGGFFAAINQYSATMSKSGEKIQEINMGNFILVNYPVPDYGISVVARCKKTKHSQSTRKTLEFIAEMFQEKYTQHEIVSWNGNLTKFDTFFKDVECFFNNEILMAQRMQSIF